MRLGLAPRPTRLRRICGGRAGHDTSVAAEDDARLALLLDRHDAIARARGQRLRRVAATAPGSGRAKPGRGRRCVDAGQGSARVYSAGPPDSASDRVARREAGGEEGREGDEQPSAHAAEDACARVEGSLILRGLRAAADDGYGEGALLRARSASGADWLRELVHCHRKL